MLECKLYLSEILLRRIRYFSSIILVSFIVFSCRATKDVSKSKPETKNVAITTLHSDFSGSLSKKERKIINDAEKYLGVPYHFGGNTMAGLDCSGFTVKVFTENNINLPRRSADQSSVGKSINIQDTKPGDLLFFATSVAGKVSHVAIVHSVENNGEIKFIHASTSKGVIISSLNERYWNKAFLFARRVL